MKVSLIQKLILFNLNLSMLMLLNSSIKCRWGVEFCSPSGARGKSHVEPIDRYASTNCPDTFYGDERDLLEGPLKSIHESSCFG